MPSPPRSPPRAGHTLSVRLSAAAHTRLVDLATAREVDPSTLVRSWIAEAGPTVKPGAAVFRWVLLCQEDRLLAHALAELSEHSPCGVVVLEDVLLQAIARGVERQAATERLMALVKTGWIEHAVALGDWNGKTEGKSPFLFVLGRLSALALERVPFGVR